jgi:translation initiation factor IF-1
VGWPFGLAKIERQPYVTGLGAASKQPMRLPGEPRCARFPAASVLGNIATFMSKGDLLEMEGVIQDALGGGQYTIKVDQGGAMVRAQLSGRMRRHHIRVLPGDKVRVAVSPYDLSHGLIVYRGRS